MNSDLKKTTKSQTATRRETSVEDAAPKLTQESITITRLQTQLIEA